MSASTPATTATTENFLDDDYVTVPGQLYALVSFVAPNGTNQRNDKFGMKIRGCFASREEAQGHVRRLQQVDRLMDIYLVDMYKWLLIPPDPNSIDDQEFQEEYLNNIMKGYRENQLLAKKHFEERKEAVRRDGLDPHLLEHERLPRPTDDSEPSGGASSSGASGLGGPRGPGGPGVDYSIFEDGEDLAIARKKQAATESSGP